MLNHHHLFSLGLKTTTILLCLPMMINVIGCVYIRPLQKENIDGQTINSSHEEVDARIASYIRQLNDRNAQVRFAATRNLAQFGSEARAAVPALIATLRDSNHEVRAAAIYTLGTIGSEARAAVPVLAQMLQDSDLRYNRNIRSTSARALAAIGPEARSAVPALVEALEDKSPGVRLESAEALGAIGSESRAAVPALEASLHDPYTRVRVNSAAALWKIGADTDESFSVLIAALQDSGAFSDTVYAILSTADSREAIQSRAATLSTSELETAILTLDQNLDNLRNTSAEGLTSAVELLLNILQTAKLQTGIIKSSSWDAETPESRMVISTYLLAFKAGFSGKMPLLITPNCKLGAFTRVSR